MTAPNDDSSQLQFAEIAAEMDSDPLSKALFERAQLKVLATKLQAQNELLRERVRELEGQRGEHTPPKRPEK